MILLLRIAVTGYGRRCDRLRVPIVARILGASYLYSSSISKIYASGVLVSVREQTNIRRSRFSGAVITSLKHPAEDR
jgi:hypothetical protein